MVTITPIAALADAVFAAELGASLLSVNSDAVAVFDSNFNQVFQNARPMEAEVIPRARLMDHPRETGELNTDYKIILPTEIILPVMIAAPFYRNTYQEILNLWNTSELLMVQCKAANYPNMVISEPPHRETPDKFDVITMHLRLREIQIVEPDNGFSPVNPVDQVTQILGEQFPSIYTILGSALGVATTVQAITFELR